MKIEVKHRVYNPLSGLPGLSTLAAICSDMEKDGWQLTRIVPHMQFESVAIFERLNMEQEKEQETELEGKEVGGGYV